MKAKKSSPYLKVVTITISIFLLHLSVYSATDDTYVALSDHTSLSAALSSIGSSEKILLIDKNDTITVDITVPDNVSLKFTRPYKFTINSGIVLTINSSVIAPPTQIFSGSGDVLFVDSAQTQIYPHWFYDDSGDWTDAFQSAIDSSNGIEIIVPRQEYVVEGTITLKEHTTLTGVGTLQTVHSPSSPTIYHDPTTSGANLFELDDETGYLQSVTVENLTFVGQNDSSEGDCFNLDQPGWSTFSNLSISGFENGLNIQSAIDTRIINCTINYSQEACIRIRGGSTISTTLTIQKCYLRSSPWAAIIEEEAAYHTSFVDTIFETTTTGGVNIYQGNDLVTFKDCYSENIVTTSIASPIFRIGVDGTSSRATLVSIIGGSYSGINGTIHADSVFAEVDKAQISILGCIVKRVGNFITTTSNTERISVFGVKAITITDTSFSGITDMSKYIGELPYLTPRCTRLNANSIKLHSPYGDTWEVMTTFNQTQSDLIWSSNGTERFRIDSNGKFGIGTTIPRATFHSTGSTIIGVPSAAINDTYIGNSQVNIYLDETNNNLKFRIRKSNGDYKIVTLPFD